MSQKYESKHFTMSGLYGDVNLASHDEIFNTTETVLNNALDVPSSTG